MLVTDEALAEIREYDPSSGKLIRSVPPPPPFRGRLSKNGGFESIAVTPDGESCLDREREPRCAAMARRRPPSKGRGCACSGSTQRSPPAGQWAYRSEPGLGYVGVVDLLVAPGGQLLALERALTGGGFSARIFELDLSRATDVSAFEKLRNRDDFWPVRKTKLWERTGGFQNFEGLALGPELASGGRLRAARLRRRGPASSPRCCPCGWNEQPGSCGEPSARSAECLRHHAIAARALGRVQAFERDRQDFLDVLCPRAESERARPRV